MRTKVACLLVLGLALLWVLHRAASAQPVGGPDGAPPPPVAAPQPPAEAPSPLPVPAAPVDPPPAATAAPTAAPSPEEKHRADVAQWIAGRGYPPWTVEYLEKYETLGMILAVGIVLARPLVFVAVMLLVGLSLPPLLRATVVAATVAPEGRPPGLTPRQAAVSALIGWCVAFIVASELIGLTWFGSVMGGVGNLLGGIARLLGSVLSAVMWVGLVALIAYAASVPSREFVLSLMGFHYLRRHPKRPGPDDVFDLGEGKLGRVAAVDLFQTSFSVDGGSTETRPNAWLMREHFGWGAPPKAAGESKA